MSLRKTATFALFLAILLIGTTLPMSAQGGNPSATTIEERHDASPSLKSLPLLPPEAGAHTNRLGHISRPGPRVLQADSVAQASAGPAIPTTSGQDFEGLGSGMYGYTVTYAPSSSNGAAGLTQYVQWVNTAFAVFNKSNGAKIYGPANGNTLWQGFGGPCENTNDGDPVVQYDKIAHRWVMSQDANVNSPSGPYYECIAVSQTEDATGAWYRYAYSYTNINDYAKSAVWPDGYYFAYNIFSGQDFLGAKVCAFDRQAMLAGTSATQVCFDLDPAYGGVLPSDLDGYTPPANGSPNYVVGYQTNGASSSLNLWKFHVDFATPANSTLTGPSNMAVATFNEGCIVSGGTCSTDIVPQPGTSTLLDSLGDRPMYRLAYRNFGDHEALVVNHAVLTGSSKVAVRWYELRDPNGTPTVYQQATWAPDSDFRFMGSAAMDSQGNMALGYSVSSSTTYPSIRYTGRLAGDTLNTLGSENTILTGTASQTTSGTGVPSHRWGDYTSMAVDPSDDCTFWYTNQYIPSNGVFNWRTRIASFKFPSCTPPPPVAVSVTPSSGSGASGTFSFVYSDSGGYNKITVAQAIINSYPTTVAGCALYYTAANNSLSLYNDAGTTLLPAVVVGQAGTLQNSQCSVNVGAASVTGGDTTLTLNVPITFTASFAGQKQTYMEVEDLAGRTSGWPQRGTWATNSVAVTPLSGSGTSQTFSFVYSDGGGYAQITVAQAIINHYVTTIAGCALYYTASNNSLSLYNDAGTTLLPAIVVGQAGTLQNSQCSVNVATVSVNGSGTTLTLTVPIAFTPSFGGVKQIYMEVEDLSGRTSGWQQQGAWATSNPPANVSVTPNSGSGSSQTFSFVYSDGGGYAQITVAQAIINHYVTTVAGCALYYTASNNSLSLYNDAGTALLPAVGVGQAGTLQNSQCSVNVGAASVTGLGTNLTLTVPLTFTASFAGQKRTYMEVEDLSGLTSGWQQLGTWGTSNPPANVSVTPNSGSGSSQTFSFVYSDGGGYAQITVAQAIINNYVTTFAGCALYYTASNNSLSLYNDAGTTLLPAIVVGQAGTLQNSQCSVNVAAASVTGLGTNLTLTVPLTFTSFTGQKQTYMEVEDLSGGTSGWQVLGSWTVP
jgi:hypothetical protein